MTRRLFENQGQIIAVLFYDVTDEPLYESKETAVITISPHFPIPTTKELANEYIESLLSMGYVEFTPQNDDYNRKYGVLKILKD